MRRIEAQALFQLVHPPPTWYLFDGTGTTISGNSKRFEGPVLNSRGSTHPGVYLNETVIDEIRNMQFAKILFPAVVK